MTSRRIPKVIGAARARDTFFRGGAALPDLQRRLSFAELNAVLGDTLIRFWAIAGFRAFVGAVVVDAVDGVANSRTTTLETRLAELRALKILQASNEGRYRCDQSQKAHPHPQAFAFSRGISSPCPTQGRLPVASCARTAPSDSSTITRICSTVKPRSCKSLELRNATAAKSADSR